MAAQEAPLTTAKLMPNFLKSPISWATTMDGQTVRAMIPNFMSGTSGESSA